MSQPLAAVTLTTGNAIPIPCGPAPAVGAVVLYNESPYAVQVRAGSKGGWLPAWTGDRYDTGGDAAWDGTLIVAAQALASNTGQAPSFSILPVIYGSGEFVPGTYPCSLTRQVQQGQIVTAVTQVIQDAQTSGQVIMEATPLVGGQTILVTTDGIAKFTGGVRFGPSAGGSFPFVFFNSGNHENEYSAPQGGSANGHLFVEWDGAAQQIPLSIGSTGVAAKTNITHAGGFFQIAGQLTAGSFGVPLDVAQALNVAYTVTGLTNILTLSAPATGFYRASIGITVQASGNVTADVQWTDPNTNGTLGQAFSAGGGGSTLNALAITAPQPISVMPLTFYAKTGTNIIVQYNNSAASPNDHITAMIERLA